MSCVLCHQSLRVEQRRHRAPVQARTKSTKAGAGYFSNQSLRSRSQITVSRHRPLIMGTGRGFWGSPLSRKLESREETVPGLVTFPPPKKKYQIKLSKNKPKTHLLPIYFYSIWLGVSVMVKQLPLIIFALFVISPLSRQHER